MHTMLGAAGGVLLPRDSTTLCEQWVAGQLLVQLLIPAQAVVGGGTVCVSMQVSLGGLVCPLAGPGPRAPLVGTAAGLRRPLGT